jgi:hypothetical protein
MLDNTNLAIYHQFDEDFGNTKFLISKLPYLSQDYLSQVTCKHFFNQQFDDFIADTAKIKLCLFEITCVANPPQDEKWIDIFHKMYPFVQKCFVFVIDLEDQMFKKIKELDLDKVIFLSPGHLNSYKLNKARTFYWNQYELEVINLYTEKFPQDLEKKLDNNSNKSKKFDILLGQHRSNKTLIYNYLKDNNLLDVNYVTYIHEWESDIQSLDRLTFLDKDITSPTNGLIQYKGFEYHLSAIVPTEIYNTTCYSVIVETSCSNDFSFSSEKIIRPILAKRLFIVFAGQYFLSNLRKLGYLTFDGIINESYDLEPDLEKRFLLACDQIRLLCQKEYSEVFYQIEHIVEHNRKIALNLKQQFTNNLDKEIRQIVLSAQTIVD